MTSQKNKKQPASSLPQEVKESNETQSQPFDVKVKQALLGTKLQLPNKTNKKNNAKKPSPAKSQPIASSKPSSTKTNKKKEAAKPVYNYGGFTGNKNNSSKKNSFESAFACNNIAIKATENLTNNYIAFTNELFSENLEVSKSFFNCRTFTDVLSLQERIFNANFESSFSEAMKTTDLIIEYSNEIAECINEEMTNNFNKLSKTFTNQMKHQA